MGYRSLPRSKINVNIIVSKIPHSVRRNENIYKALTIHVVTVSSNGPVQSCLSVSLSLLMIEIERIASLQVSWLRMVTFAHWSVFGSWGTTMSDLAPKPLTKARPLGLEFFCGSFTGCTRLLSLRGLESLIRPMSFFLISRGTLEWIQSHLN